MDSKVTAIIVAGGTGERMKSDVPKQFLELGDKPIIIHTIEKFDTSPLVSDIVIVCHESYIDEIKSLLVEYKMGKIYKIDFWASPPIIHKTYCRIPWKH